MDDLFDDNEEEYDEDEDDYDEILKQDIENENDELVAVAAQ